MVNLRKIEVYGFKSFSDKLDMKFDYPVTGIVGPNGCGKSNVCDAIRWVLGEQSTKSLRGKSMQDLIFAGTEKRKSMSYCEVSLFMDNKSRIFPIDMDEIIISRKLYRNNESEYFLNKNLVRLKDILDILRDVGLGREGYSIVGQGRMDAILNARPEERRAIFEEALGISKFRVRKVETERKLAKTKDNMSQLYIILNELERQLTPLKKQASNTTKYLAYQDDLKYHEINSYIYGYDSASEKKDALKEKIAKLDAQITFLNDKYVDANEKYDKVYREMNNIDALISDFRNQQLELSIQQERFSGETRLLNERVKNFTLNCEDCNLTISSDKELIERVKKNIEDLTVTNTGKKLEHETTKALLSKLNEQNLTMADNIASFQEKMEEAQKQVISIMNELTEQRSRNSALNSEKMTLSNRLVRVNRDIDEINQRIAKLSKEQSQDIDNLIEGNYKKVTADVMAQNIDDFVTAILDLLNKVVLENDLKQKVSNLISDVSSKSKTELLVNSSLQHENWQQNLILLSALKERFSKYAALHQTEKSAVDKLILEKNQLEHRLSEIDTAISSVEGALTILVSKKDNASNYATKFQSEYSSIKADKDKVVDDISSTRIKLSTLMSTIMSNESTISSNKQTIIRANNEIAQKTRQIEGNKASIEELYKQIAESTNNKVDMELLNSINQKLSDAGKLKSDLQTQFAEADHVRQNLSVELTSYNEQHSKEEYNLLKIDDDITALQEKILNDYGLTYSSAMQFKDEEYDLTKSKDEINRLRTLMSKIYNVNFNAVKEYEDTLTRYNDINSQMDDMKKAEADLNSILKDLTREIVVRFNDAFEIINLNFGQVFKELFAGGHAHMNIDVDETKDELDYGIEIEAQPPGKKLQNISLLSGGERTLTAAAILFAILKLRPMPFCVLDEIEAALDDANAERIASYIRKFASDTQFIVITHKKPTMEACDVLYGVTMEEKGVSKIVSVQLTDAIKTAVN